MKSFKIFALAAILVVGRFGSAHAGELFFFPGAGDAPPTNAAARVVVTSTGSAGFYPLADQVGHNFYTINFAATGTTCWDFKGTVLNDWFPKACSGGANAGAPCTVNGDCASNTCGNHNVTIDLYDLNPSKICSGGANANQECGPLGDTDCPSSTCVANTGGYVFDQSLTCVDASQSLLAANIEIPDGTLGAIVTAKQGSSVPGLLFVETFPTLSRGGQNCDPGDEFIYRLCRVAGDASDTSPAVARLAAVLMHW